MVRIYTQSVIAFMKNPKAVRNGATIYFPSKPMHAMPLTVDNDKSAGSCIGAARFKAISGPFMASIFEYAMLSLKTFFDSFWRYRDTFAADVISSRIIRLVCATRIPAHVMLVAPAAALCREIASWDFADFHAAYCSGAFI